MYNIMSCHRFVNVVATTLVVLIACNAQTEQNASETVEDVKIPVYSWLSEPVDAVAAYNETIFIDCVGKSSDEDAIESPPVSSWRDNEGKVISVQNNTSENDVYVLKNGTLVVRNLNEMYVGDYTCSLSLEFEKKINVRLGNSVELGTFDTDSFGALIDCNTKLLCSARGDGDVKVAWYHNGKILNDQNEVDSVEKLNDTVHLSFEIAKVKMDDEGLYTCIASNRYGKIVNESITLEVLNKTEGETCTNTTIMSTVPKMRRNDLKNFDVIEDDEVHVTDFVLNYIVPAIVVGCILLAAIIIAVILIVRKRKQQQNAIFSGVKYRRTEGNEENIRA